MPSRVPMNPDTFSPFTLHLDNDADSGADDPAFEAYAAAASRSGLLERFQLLPFDSLQPSRLPVAPAVVASTVSSSSLSMPAGPLGPRAPAPRQPMPPTSPTSSLSMPAGPLAPRATTAVAEGVPSKVGPRVG